MDEPNDRARQGKPFPIRAFIAWQITGVLLGAFIGVAVVVFALPHPGRIADPMVLVATPFLFATVGGIVGMLYAVKTWR
jgi:hypothetical protein